MIVFAQVSKVKAVYPIVALTEITCAISKLR